MGIVAGHAITNSRLVNAPFDLSGILVAMTIQANLIWNGGDKLDAGGVPVNPNLVAAHTPHGHGRVHRLTLGFVFVTLKTRRGVGFWVELDRVHSAKKL